MATYGEMVRDIIELHEKLNYDENLGLRPRILDAINRAISTLWSKAEWTFRIREQEIDYDPDEIDNTLPDDFLTFHHTGRVAVLGADGEVQYNLSYMPINEMLRCLRAARPSPGGPEFYSLGGPIQGGGSQRSLYIFPRPPAPVTVRLIYQAVRPQGDIDHLDRTIESIPETWHFVIKEIAILNRLIDKSGDTSVQAALVKTSLDGMFRDEPHGKEDMPKMQPAYAWRMRMR